MTDDTNVEKLASVLNNTGQQGKNDFVKMLWKNQPVEVQTQLLPLLDAAARQIIETIPE